MSTYCQFYFFMSMHVNYSIHVATLKQNCYLYFTKL